MGSTLFCLALVLQPKLTFGGGQFVIQDGADRLNVPLSAADAPVAFRGDKLKMTVGETLVTFDQRGLGIQYGKKGGFTSVAYMPTNPKLFSTEEIKRNADLVQSGERSLKVSALSGFEVVKDRLYLLLRWDDKDAKPWLETLVSVDTSGDAPKIELLGRFGGFSFTSGPVCDELYSVGTRLYVAVRGTDGLGIGSCDTEKGVTDYKRLGPIVDDCVRFGSMFYTVTTAPYGLRSVGVLDPVADKFRVVLETRGTVVPSALTSTLLVFEGSVTSLYSVFSGAKLPIEQDSGCAQTPYGVLVWTPRAKPTKAVLRETERWAVVCDWKAKTP